MKQELILYNSADGKSSVALLARDGSVWLNQMQIAELFATSKQNISVHIGNILKEKELDENSTIKYFLTTVSEMEIVGNYQNGNFRTFRLRNRTI